MESLNTRIIKFGGNDVLKDRYVKATKSVQVLREALRRQEEEFAAIAEVFSLDESRSVADSLWAEGEREIAATIYLHNAERFSGTR